MVRLWVLGHISPMVVKVCGRMKGSKIQLDGLKTGVMCSRVFNGSSHQPFVITLCTLQIAGKI
jgi:hypothetical protein